MKKIIKCNRCGLTYANTEENCSYCFGLNDQEVKDIIYQFKQESALSNKLGSIFIGWSLKYRKYSNNYNEQQKPIQNYRLIIVVISLLVLIMLQIFT